NSNERRKLNRGPGVAFARSKSKKNIMKRIIAKIGIVTVTLALAISAQAGSITVKGSDTLIILAQKWAEVYMGKHPEVKIQVTGGGSGVGLAALQNGQTDIANSSRPIK